MSTDKREFCRYGSDCYQNNPKHHEKYKHPEKKKIEHVKKGQKRSFESMKNQKLDVFFKKVTNSSNERENNALHRAGEDIPGVTTTVGFADTISDSIQKRPEEIKKIIKDTFLVDMPNDFYSFGEYCKNLNPSNPCGAMNAFKLRLVGPFEILFGVWNTDVDPSSALCHWRYYFDPPEFQTVIISEDKDDELHFGYFRDCPDEMPVFVASNCSAKNCIIEPTGENIFASLILHMKHISNESDVFLKVKLSSNIEKMTRWASDYHFNIQPWTESMYLRSKKVVAKTFHKAGIVVPYDQDTDVGYRPMSVKDGELREILKRIANSKLESEKEVYLDKLRTIMAYVNMANDECDFGTGLELGVDMFSYGDPILHPFVLDVLTTAYTLLNRQKFIDILNAHLRNRKKGNELSVLKQKREENFRN